MRTTTPGRDVHIAGGNSHAPSSETGVSPSGLRPQERPILFSGPMVRAILEGRKTQTRRIVKPQPPSVEAVHKLAGDGYHWLNNADIADASTWRPVGPVWAVRKAGWHEPLRCPYGVTGDRLWVRETWGRHDDERCNAYTNNQVIYRADYESDDTAPLVIDDRWRPSIHMTRWASRITLEVTEVRVERLQDITEEDARAEGVDWAGPQFLPSDGDDDREDPREVGYPSAGASFARDNFQRLWDQINGERSPWESSPWVWVVGFRRLQP